MKETLKERLQLVTEAIRTPASGYTHITKRRIQKNKIALLYVQYSVRIIGVWAKGECEFEHAHIQ